MSIININNKLKKLPLEFKARVLIDFTTIGIEENLKGKEFYVIGDVTSGLVTLDVTKMLPSKVKGFRHIQFTLKEVKLLPQAYNVKEQQMIFDVLR
jgi:hypothetical protein